MFLSAGPGTMLEASGNRSFQPERLRLPRLPFCFITLRFSTERDFLVSMKLPSGQLSLYTQTALTPSGGRKPLLGIESQRQPTLLSLLRFSLGGGRSQVTVSGALAQEDRTRLGGK